MPARLGLLAGGWEQAEERSSRALGRNHLPLMICQGLPSSRKRSPSISKVEALAAASSGLAPATSRQQASNRHTYAIQALILPQARGPGTRIRGLIKMEPLALPAKRQAASSTAGHELHDTKGG